MAVASIVTKMGLWSETWSTGLATTALVMVMFLVYSWSSWLPSLWVIVPSLSAGVSPAPII